MEAMSGIRIRSGWILLFYYQVSFVTSKGEIISSVLFYSVQYCITVFYTALYCSVLFLHYENVFHKILPVLLRHRRVLICILWHKILF
jgi:hypothetical protein